MAKEGLSRPRCGLVVGLEVGIPGVANASSCSLLNEPRPGLHPPLLALSSVIALNGGYNSWANSALIRLLPEHCYRNGD